MHEEDVKVAVSESEADDAGEGSWIGTGASAASRATGMTPTLPFEGVWIQCHDPPFQDVRPLVPRRVRRAQCGGGGGAGRVRCAAFSLRGRRAEFKARTPRPRPPPTVRPRRALEPNGGSASSRDVVAAAGARWCAWRARKALPRRGNAARRGGARSAGRVLEERDRVRRKRISDLLARAHEGALARARAPSAAQAHARAAAASRLWSARDGRARAHRRRRARAAAGGRRRTCTS